MSERKHDKETSYTVIIKWFLKISSNSRIVWLWLITIFPERMAGSIKEFPFKKPILSYDSERTAGYKVMRATTFDSHVAMDITIQKKEKFINTDKHKKVKDERLATSFSKIKERSKLLEICLAPQNFIGTTSLLELSLHGDEDSSPFLRLPYCNRLSLESVMLVNEKEYTTINSGQLLITTIKKKLNFCYSIYAKFFFHFQKKTQVNVTGMVSSGK